MDRKIQHKCQRQRQGHHHPRRKTNIGHARAKAATVGYILASRYSHDHNTSQEQLHKSATLLLHFLLGYKGAANSFARMLEGHERAPAKYSCHPRAILDTNASRDYENASPGRKRQATAALSHSEPRGQCLHMDAHTLAAQTPRKRVARAHKNAFRQKQHPAKTQRR
jgi:hypothetical protein